jgi:hypothetical protein
MTPSQARREAVALARRGLPHPDPAVQRAIVRYAHRLDRAQWMAQSVTPVAIILGLGFALRSVRQPGQWLALAAVRRYGCIAFSPRILAQPMEGVLGTAVAMHRASLGLATADGRSSASPRPSDPAGDIG